MKLIQTTSYDSCDFESVEHELLKMIERYFKILSKFDHITDSKFVMI